MARRQLVTMLKTLAPQPLVVSARLFPVGVCGGQRTSVSACSGRTLHLQQCRGMVFKTNWGKVAAKKEEGPAHRPAEDHHHQQASMAPPPPSQVPGALTITPSNDLTPVEARARLEDLLSEPYLAVQRRLELGSVLIGFEQANHYTLFNRNGQVRWL